MDKEMLEDLFFDSFQNKEEIPLSAIEGWCTSNNKDFFFTLKSIPTVSPGLYGLSYSEQAGYGISKMEYKKEDYIEFPSSPNKEILKGIQDFWANKEVFKKYNLTPKRGIILWGKPGCGKTSCIYLLVEEIKKQNGIAVYFNNPDNWIAVAQKIRKIEPDRPLLCIIEDLDLVIQQFGEQVFLNFLDGLNQVDNVVYVATTNNVSNIPDRIKNRPSRFDQLYEIKIPTEKDRLMYFESVLQEEDKATYSLTKLAKDTKDFSMAHLRETFISLYIMKAPYKETLSRLKTKKITDQAAMGFDTDDEDDEN